MASTHTKRGAAFRLEDLEPSDDHEPNVQFVTPYYEEPGMPEPLDLSKLCLDDDLFEKDATELSQQDEEVQTRGRSRSRSVHENDLAAADLIPSPEITGVPIGDHSADAGQKGKKSAGEDKGSRRGGPLQQREVQALKKGLEEANQSLNKNQSREDEEERMAADAEKRKRLLQANSAASSSGGGSAAGRRVKLLMLGDSGVGKSSLIMRWTHDSFSPSLVSTVGVNFKSRKVNIGSEAVQVQVWDTAGQEQFHKITTSYYKGAQGIMLVYDVTDLASLANIEYWIKNIKSHATDSVQVALIGNKTDLRPAAGSPSNSGEPTKKCCETARGQEIAHKYGIPFFETSAKESSNVEIAFLTLVEHIVESGGGATSAVGPHSPSPQGLGHAGAAQGAGAAGANGTGAGGGKSIVEKASEKARMFSGAFKRTASATAGKSSPPPLPSPTNGNGAANGGSNGGTAAAGQDGAGAGVGADGEDKEKCVIS